MSNKLNVSNFNLQIGNDEVVEASKVAKFKSGNFAVVKDTVRMSVVGEMGKPACLLIEDSKSGWKPKESDCNILCFDVTINEPGPDREVILAQVVTVSGIAAAQIVWMDHEATGKGKVVLRVKEYMPVNPVDVVLKGEVEIGEEISLILSLKKDSKIEVATIGSRLSVDSFQLNAQSYSNESFRFVVGPQIEENDDGLASVVFTTIGVLHKEAQ